MTRKFPELEQRKRYVFVWKMDYQRNYRETVGQFLGYNAMGDIQINLRPLAGTSTLSEASVISVKPTDEPILIERILR